MEPAESLNDLVSQKEVLELLVKQMTSVCSGRRRDLVPYAARREAQFRQELAAVDEKISILEKSATKKEPALSV